MTTDLGFFSPAVIAQSQDDDKSQEIQDVNTSNMEEEVDSLVVENKPQLESATEVPHDFELEKTNEIFDRFLSNDLNYGAAQALDARHYLEHVIYIYLL